MSRLDEVRWGIIGCGDVTEVKSGPGFQRARGSSLAAVMRRTPGLAEDYAKRHGVGKWYESAEELINDGEVNAVYVATPPGSHKEYALMAFAAGKPAYVEKPMARNYAECVEMVEAFGKAGLGLYVAYYRRGWERFGRAREIVESGRLGQITGIRYEYASNGSLRIDPGNRPWRVRAEESGGGLFMDMGSHTLDILDFMMGPICEVAGVAANMSKTSNVEDRVLMHFRTESGVLGTASWNFAAGARKDEIEIVGTAGSMQLSTFGGGKIRLCVGENVEEFEVANPACVQQPLIQTVVDELLGKGKCPSTGESAARTARVMDAVLEEYYGGRGDGFWDRPETWGGRD